MTKKTAQLFEIPPKVKRVGKLLQFFSTPMAAKFALNIFMTPPKFATPEREQMMQKSVKAIPFEVPQIDRKIMVYEYGFSKTRILLAHAWAGRATQLYEIADKLLENGMMVITYDGPAHGLSEGTRTHILENTACMDAINEKFGPFEAAIGHSFGGISLMIAQAKKPMFPKLITLGIAAYTDKIIEDFIHKLELNSKVCNALIQRIEKDQPGGINETSAAEAAKKINVPTLIIHDTDDTDVDVSNAYKIRQNLKQGRLLITNGLGHRRIIRDFNTIVNIIKFIQR
ncbi:alpha/beta hydrolase [Flavobacteriaceae bacterium F08102]|nr:alpha/beta hydrolase [Flavobacteriaceae bacterium F08102]